MSITVKLDRNYNSMADSYDWPLGGVVIKLIRDTHKGGIVVASSVSTGSGTAVFSVFAPPGATYHLSVRDQPWQADERAARACFVGSCIVLAQPAGVCSDYQGYKQV